MIGGAASAASAAMQNKAAKKQAAQQYENDMAAAEQQRVWNIEDRDEERIYNRQQLDIAQAYNREQELDARGYNEQREYERRGYDRTQELDRRAYDAEMLAQARQYNRQELDEARAYHRSEMLESREYDRGALSRLVADAEGAGFNPLTVLRAGAGGGGGVVGASGFAPLSSPSLMAAPLTGQPLATTALSTVSLTSPSYRRTAPVRQAVGGSVLADGVRSIADFIRDFDPHMDAKREAEFGLIAAQTRNLEAQTAAFARPGSWNVPMYASGEIERRPTSRGGALSKSKDDIPALYVPFRDRDGNIVEVANPDLPDLDQLFVPPVSKAFDQAYRGWQGQSGGGNIQRAGRGAAKIYQAVRDLYTGKGVRISPQTPAQKKAIAESWLPSWVPRFSWE